MHKRDNEEKGHDIEDKKEEDKKEIMEDENEKHTKRKQNTQVKWIVFLMISVILIIVVVPFVNKNFINTFDYKGLEFQKTKLGDLVFYSTRFPVVIGTGEVIGTYAVNLRNDPRKLEKIKTDITDDIIRFSITRDKYDPVYISLNPFMEICEDSVISMAGLSGFLKDSGLKINTAYTDKAYAKSHNSTQRWCDNSVYDTVIVVTDGNETSVKEIGPFCYEIKFKDCEIMQSTERFMVIILEEYVSRFINENDIN